MTKTIEQLSEKAVRLNNVTDVPEEILSLVGDAQFVLLGEASHGTHEFYRYRAEITKRLIEEKQFSAVAAEADFPDAYRVNRYVARESKDETARDALAGFTRFPLWMWRNEAVSEFVEWLKNYNDKLNLNDRAGFFGIDLYSLHASIEAVLNYLDKTDPTAAKRARSRYSCFDHYGDDPQHYGYAASFNLSNSCETEVVNELVDLQKHALDYMNRDGFLARDEFFFAEQNARLVKNAEEYYREMFHDRASSWNLRDRHMTEALIALAAHLETQNRPPKAVVWAHNSHLGDARATDMSRRGEWNVGQLAREKFGRTNVCSIGFTTYTGTVTAASNWNEPAQSKQVNRGMKDSFEKLFHETGLENFFLDLRDEEIRDALKKPLLERAIGVIYRPETERASHYFYARLPDQFDGIIHFDTTRAVRPLDRAAGRSATDAPETFPEGI